MRDFIGQTRVLNRLSERAIEGGLAHAYVFSGPRSIGKHTAAIRLAQTLNCESETAGGCGTCLSCQKTERGSHPDVLTITRLIDRDKSQNDARNIYIDQIRSMQSDLALRPLEGRSRVVIIDDAAELGQDAQVALLKTLEEPPRHAVLLLITPTPSALLETVQSRAQVLHFNLVPEAEIAEGLTTRFGKDAAKHAVGVGGRPGLAISLATDEPTRAARQALDAELYRLISARLTERFAWAVSMSDERDTQKRAHAVDLRFAHWSELLRDAALVARGAETRALRGDRSKESAALGASVPARSLVDITLLMERMHEDLEFTVNARTMLELFALKLPYSEAVGSPR